MVPLVGLQFVVVVFPDENHLLFGWLLNILLAANVQLVFEYTAE